MPKKEQPEGEVLGRLVDPTRGILSENVPFRAVGEIVKEGRYGIHWEPQVDLSRIGYTASAPAVPLHGVELEKAAIAMYEHLLAVSYSPEFASIRMHRVHPVTLYFAEVDSSAIYGGIIMPFSSTDVVLQAIQVALGVFGFDVVVQYPAQEGSYLKKLLVRSHHRATKAESDKTAVQFVNTLAIHLSPAAEPRTSERDAAAQERDRAEARKLSKEGFNHLSQGIRNCLVSGSILWFLLFDGAGIGNAGEGGPDQTVLIDGVEEMFEATSPEGLKADVAKILEKFRKVESGAASDPGQSPR